MDNRPIGVFDSGLGGLTAIKELEEILPHEDIIYFGDTGRVPYGTRSSETVNKYSQQDISFLKSHNVKAILAACGTVSSVARNTGKNIGIPFFDVLEATCNAAIKMTKNNKIGVIATPATIASSSYKKLIESKSNEIEVYEQPCPMFVPLVENGYISPQDEVTRLVAERSLSPIRNKEIDTLILGCTHYPIISLTISSVIGRNVKLINSGREAALMLAETLKKNDMLNDKNSIGEKSYYVSDDTKSFLSIAEIFLGHSVKGYVERIDIEKY